MAPAVSLFLILSSGDTCHSEGTCISAPPPLLFAKALNLTEQVLSCCYPWAYSASEGKKIHFHCPHVTLPLQMSNISKLYSYTQAIFLFCKELLQLLIPLMFRTFPEQIKQEVIIFILQVKKNEDKSR